MGELESKEEIVLHQGRSMHKGPKSNNTECMRKKRAEMDTGRRSKQKPVSAGSEELWERTKVHCCEVREL